MKRIRLSLLAAAIALVALPAAADAQTSYPGIPWSDLLPSQASPSADNPGPVSHCHEPGMRCIQAGIRRLREARNRFGCDHRAVFATTYMTLTRVLQGMLREDPQMVR